MQQERFLSCSLGLGKRKSRAPEPLPPLRYSTASLLYDVRARGIACSQSLRAREGEGGGWAGHGTHHCNLLGAAENGRTSPEVDVVVVGKPALGATKACPGTAAPSTTSEVLKPCMTLIPRETSCCLSLGRLQLRLLLPAARWKGSRQSADRRISEIPALVVGARLLLRPNERPGNAQATGRTISSASRVLAQRKKRALGVVVFSGGCFSVEAGCL